MAEYSYLLSNPVVWAILLAAVVCYSLLLDLCFVQSRTESWARRVDSWIIPVRILLSGLPLLGLLGTITGLLKTFADMSVSGGVVVQQIVTSGIADAMFTTQLGLILVVPGLILHTYLIRQYKIQTISGLHEIKY